MDVTAIAYHRLSYSGDDRDVDNSVVEFMETMCELENDLLEFEGIISRQDIGLSGLRGSRELGNLERRHADFVDELQQAYRGIVTGRFTELDRYPAEKHHDRSRYEIFTYRNDFLRIYARLEEIADRIGRRIDGKRNSANSRLVFSISCIAVILAVLSLISQAIF